MAYTIRENIINIFTTIETTDLYFNEVIKDFYKNHDLPKRDRAFIERVVRGVIENSLYIDFCINKISKTKINKMKPIIRRVIRMTTYQILFMDKVPDFSAINEAVKIVRKRKMSGLSGFVNGVCRNIARKKEEFPKMLEELSFSKRLSITYSIKEELVIYLMKQLENEKIEVFLKESSKNKDTCIRTNITKVKPEELYDLLKGDYTIRKANIHKENFFLKDYDSLIKIKAFRNGLFSVQDESSSNVAHIANPKADDKVLDVCAAPGGKSLHIAEIMQQKGCVYSCDISEPKIEKIQDNAKRLGLNNIKTKILDAMVFNEEFDKKFDIVLADVPCSALGVIRNKPDIKQNMTVEGINEIIEIQESIINNVSNYVKSGGTLVYSTCTINKNENINQINKFLENNKEFELIDIANENVSNKLKPFIKEKCLQIYTDENIGDGFFIAKLRRK